MRLIGAIGTVLAALLASAALASGALAENGLQRFEREVKPQLELHELFYRSGAALGDQGFVLNDVVAVAPPNPATDGNASTIRIDTVTVETIDFDRLGKDNKDDMPRFLKLRFEGVTGDDTAANSLAAYGIPQTPADIALDYRFDTAAKRLTLNKLEISLRGPGRLTFALVIGGVSDKASARILEVNARSQGNTPDGQVALGLIAISGVAGPQGPEAIQAFDALASFVADWKAPQGPITITVNPAKGTSLADLGTLMVSNALHDVLGLTVDYPGTRAGAATAAPALK